MARLSRNIIVSSVVVSAAYLAGCDDHAAQVAQSRAQLDEAIALINQAERGYVPESSGGAYGDYRLTKLDEAVGKLNEVIGTGDVAVKATAQRQMGNVRLAIARAKAADAVQAYDIIRGDSTALFNHLNEVERINALIRTRTGDGGSVIAALDEGDRMVARSRAELSSSLSELNAAREQAVSRAEALFADAAKQFNAAQKAEEKAFTIESSEERQSLHNAAYQAKQQGEAKRYQAQQQQIEADSLAAEIAPLQTEVELWDTMGQQISQLKSKAQTNQAEASRDVTAASAEKVQAVATVSTQYQNLTTVFNQQVKAPLDTAVADATAAVASYESALSAQSNMDKDAVSFELLAARTELAHLLTTQARLSSGFAEMVKAIAADPAVADHADASTYASQAQEFASQSDAYTSQARSVIGVGIEQAGSLSNSGLVAGPAQSLAQALRGYDAQLN